MVNFHSYVSLPEGKAEGSVAINMVSQGLGHFVRDLDATVTSQWGILETGKNIGHLEDFGTTLILNLYIIIYYIWFIWYYLMFFRNSFPKIPGMNGSAWWWPTATSWRGSIRRKKCAPEPSWMWHAGCSHDRMVKTSISTFFCLIIGQ